MSIDVFGRKLTQSDGSRGPSGIGFKLTDDGQFDLENKRLCLVADAADLQDVVNVQVLRKVLSDELGKFFEIVKAQKKEVDEISSSTKLIFEDIEKKLKNINKNISKLSTKIETVEQELSRLKRNGE